MDIVTKFDPSLSVSFRHDESKNFNNLIKLFPHTTV